MSPQGRKFGYGPGCDNKEQRPDALILKANSYFARARILVCMEMFELYQSESN